MRKCHVKNRPTLLLITGNVHCNRLLLGEIVAEELRLLAELEEIPDPEKIGIILAGDVYADWGENSRGQSGDATKVWEAFAERFAWVAGVPGNHDRFHPDYSLAENIYYLDGDSVEVMGLKIAGLGGIMGNPQKPMRRAANEYLKVLQQLLGTTPDILILHEGPEAPQKGFIGSKAIRQQLVGRQEPLVISGHCHWDDPLVIFPDGLQALNVDSRGILLPFS